MGEYIRAERKSRRSGTTIQVLDTQHPDTEWLTEERWAIVCAAHAVIMVTNTLTNAIAQMARPDEWCDGCYIARIAKEDSCIF